MGYFQVRYDSRVINYDCRGFIRLATEVATVWTTFEKVWLLLLNLATLGTMTKLAL